MATAEEERARKLRLEFELLNIEDPEELGPVDRFAAGTGVGVAKTLGAPVDIVNSILQVAGLGSDEPFGGSVNIQKGLEKLRVGVAPGTELGRAGRVGELVGTAATAGPAIVAGGVKSLAGQAIGTQPRVVAGIAQETALNAMQNPVRFVALEGASAVGAGLASYEASERYPENPTVQMLAEIAGGVGPIAAIFGTKALGRASVWAGEKMPLTGAMIRGVRKGFNSITPTGATQRAQQRVARATPDQDASSARVNRTDILDDSGLTPVQRAGDPELLALERDIMESNVELSAARAEQLGGVNARIRESLVGVAEESVPTHQAKKYFEGLIDARIRQAALIVDEKLAKLEVRPTREDINTMARVEMNKARIAARAQERQLYEAIPGEARVPTAATQEAYTELKLSLASAQREDLSPTARRLLEPSLPGKKGPKLNPDFLGDETSIQEMRGLSGKLREEARIARADKRFKSARISDEIADAINDDIANTIGSPEVREAVDLATSFSVDYNNRFTRGPVARILGSERAGGQTIPDSLTLEATVGQRGPRSRAATDALLETVRRNGDEEAMRGYIADFLTDDFRRAAIVDGQIDLKATSKWLVENQDTLNRFPELRRDIISARQSGGSLVDAERFADPKISRAAVFVNAPPGDELERVLNGPQPREALAELLKMARRDPTGKAEQGLKSAFFDMLLKKSEIPAKLDVNETPFISGRKLADELNTETTAEGLRGLFTRGEIERIQKIRETALLLDNARMSGGSAEGVIGDQPGKLMEIIARVGGAQLGRVIAGHTGGGTVQTPGILAAQVRRLLQSGVQDPARRLLTDSISDEKLFKALLLPQDTEVNVKATRVALNAWAVDLLNEQHANEAEE